MYNLILLGAPAAGKGTQAARLSAGLHIPAISTGDIIRAVIKSGSPLAKKLAEATEHGGLAPDDLVNQMVLERLKQDDCKNGFLLDGYPRTVAQAEFLRENGIPITKVLYLETSVETVTFRMMGRRICSGCGASYHLKNHPPKKEGVCDRCGKELIARKDDHPDTLHERLRVFQEKTAPLTEYYASVLLKVDANREKDEVAEEILQVLKNDPS